MIVVDDFAALDNAGVGACLGRSPSTRLCCADGNEITAFVAGKGVSLGCRNTYFPVKGPVCLFFGRRGSRNADAIIPGRNLTHNPILLSEEEGQNQRQYERQMLHQRKYSLFFASSHHRRKGTRYKLCPRAMHQSLQTHHGFTSQSGPYRPVVSEWSFPVLSTLCRIQSGNKPLCPQPVRSMPHRLSPSRNTRVQQKGPLPAPLSEGYWFLYESMLLQKRTRHLSRESRG